MQNWRYAAHEWKLRHYIRSSWKQGTQKDPETLQTKISAEKIRLSTSAHMPECIEWECLKVVSTLSWCKNTGQLVQKFLVCSNKNGECYWAAYLKVMS